jgi:hypothetical protein
MVLGVILVVHGMTSLTSLKFVSMSKYTTARTRS